MNIPEAMQKAIPGPVHVCNGTDKFYIRSCDGRYVTSNIDTQQAKIDYHVLAHCRNHFMQMYDALCIAQSRIFFDCPELQAVLDAIEVAEEVQGI